MSLPGKDNWIIRRTMAVAAFISAVVFYPLLVMLAEPANAELLVQLAVPYYALVTLVLTAYYGIATYDDVDERKYQNG